MQFKSKLIPALLVVMIMAVTAACSRKEAAPPNIIIIFTDDQGYADLGCYGAQDFKTPNIDKLADEGMRFTSFYVSEAVCSASRSSLMTGCYAQRVGIRGALSPYAMTGLNREEETIASMLKNQGYATCMAGKWHLGSVPEFYPTNYGFDEYLGIPYSNDMWPVGYDGKHLSEGFKSIYPALPLIENDSVIDTFESLEEQNKITGLYTERAVDFIKRNPDNPFFLYLAHSMVHVPLAVNDAFRGSSEQGMYGDVMQEVDWSVGEIMTTLKELGLEDNTLIIYASDNGPWLNFGNHAGSAFPLREGKGNAWEGGVRVPCIMYYPELIKGGLTMNKMASTLDILPTLAAITGAPLPEKEIDGVNILPLLQNTDGAQPRQEFIYYYQGGLCAVRRGDWKLVVPHKYRSYEGVEPGNDGFPGPYARGTAGLELYNLVDDISECKDVSEKFPDKVEELLGMADSVRLALGDRTMGVRGNTNRSPGRLRMVAEGISHLAIGKKYTIKNKPSHRYPGGSEFALTDGYLASLEFTDESWMGFHGDDLEIYIDMEKQEDIQNIEISFLKNQASWIFPPQRVEIFASKDMKNFSAIDAKDFSKAGKDLSITRESYQYKGAFTAQYIKINVINTGKCPDWHPGKEDPAWLFVDEVVIK
ncbi:MAG: sulfatase [Bacteroidota bacterium]